VEANAGSADGLIAAKHSPHRGKAADGSHRDVIGKILELLREHSILFY
jgi:hypothetical protein